jgi:hypothetical protein
MEQDSSVRSALIHDLSRLKAEIGRRVLELPEDEPLTPVFERCHKTKTTSLISPGSPAAVKPLQRETFSPELLLLRERFEQFLAERNDLKQKSFKRSKD